MDWTRRQLLGATGVAIGLAGCTGAGGGGGSDGSGGGAGTTASGGTGSGGATEGGSMGSTTATETPMAAGPTVGVGSHPEYGEILVGPDGNTLYLFEKDTKGQDASTCTDGCADAWPPLTVEGEPTAGDGVTADLTTFEREDGSTQVAAAGWPLYFFASDERPGDAKGQGINDVWWVLRPDGTPIKGEESTETTAPPVGATVQVGSHPEYGEILVGPEGKTLYLFEKDTKGQAASTCSGGCAENWPPLTVEGEPTAGDGVTADLTTFEREDGSTQVAAAGWPLYFFASDEQTGDAKGQGIGGVWWVLAPDGAPIRS